MRLNTVRLFPLLLCVSSHAQVAAPSVPPAIQNPFRFGPPGNIAGAAFDAAGNLYVAGVTLGRFGGIASPVPAAATLIGPAGGEADLYVMKIAPSSPLSPNTPWLVYVTGIGGSGQDWPSGMAVASDGSVFLTGGTDSPDFPTTPGSFQPVSATGGGFLLKLDPSGAKLSYATYIDRQGTSAYALAIDGHGNAYVGGTTDGQTFPTTPGAYRRNVTTDPFADAPYTTGFVSEFDANGATLLLSTLFGGPSLDGYVSVNAIGVDQSGGIHISGSTGGAPDFPITPALPYASGLLSSGSGFLARLNSSASTLLYSMPLDAGSVLKLDSGGNTYLAGQDMIKVDPTGTIVYDTPNVQGTSLIVQSDGSAVVAGITVNVPNFPTKNTLYPCGLNVPQQLPSGFALPPGNAASGTLTILDASGNITVSTLLGGSGFSELDAIALDPRGTLYAVALPPTRLPEARSSILLMAGRSDSNLTRVPFRRAFQRPPVWSTRQR